MFQCFSAQAIIGNFHHATAAPVQKKRFLVDSTYSFHISFSLSLKNVVKVLHLTLYYIQNLFVEKQFILKQVHNYPERGWVVKQFTIRSALNFDVTFMTIR